MDILSQAVFGSSLSQSFADDKSKQLIAFIIGALAGMAPDLDVLIRSSNDPLLFLEFHRQFTHSLIFIPFGALLCTLLFYPLIKKKLYFSQIYLFSFLGIATHGLLDACTSYGTQLFWPFSDERVAWSIVSIVDPLFTIPIIILIGLAIYRQNRKYARAAFIYAFIFLSLGLFQKQRAENALHLLAKQRDHQTERILVKPSFGNRLVWKLIYEYQGQYYVDAVKLIWSEKFILGSSIKKLNIERDFEWLDKNSRQANDIERFRWFSDDFLAVDVSNKNIITDVRYSMLPNEIKLMWGIELIPTKLDGEHVGFTTNTKLSSEDKNKYFNMLF